MIDKEELYLRSYESIVYHFKCEIDNTLPARRTHHSRDGHRFSFIPAPHSVVADELLRILDHASHTRNRVHSFLDVGCGIGNIMRLASSLHLLSHGIEYDENILKYAFFHVLKAGSSRTVNGIFHIDALEFKEYDRYDIIYYYCPMCDNKLEDSLERKIQEEMHTKAYLLSIYRDRIFDRTRFKKISDLVWQKK